MTRNRLTAKQEAFCVNYFTMRNATKAAREAGYSPHLLDTHSNHLLENASIKARLAELQAAIIPTVEVLKDAYDKRVKALVQVIEHKIETPVSAGHRIAAVHEVNLMEHIYAPGGNIRNVNVVFVIGKGYKNIPQLVEGEDAT